MDYDNKNQRLIAKRISDSTYRLPQWRDWHWQTRHTIKDIDSFEDISGISFPPEEKKNFKNITAKFPMAVTPYYLSLIDRSDYINDPIFRQAFPDPRELTIFKCDMNDPLSEDKDHPVPCIIHRYPDRVVFLVSNTCAMYCRHCTRKRRVGDVDSIPSRREIKEGIKYIKKNPQIRDVLLSGGDPFLLSDEYLEWIIAEVREIPHVEVIRIGTRAPVVLPYRVTKNLAGMLKKYHPIWVNTQFNHPREITVAATKALATLADAGIPLGNQSVLLAGINDCPRIIKRLMHQLVQNRVRPYYLYQCDLAEGLSHFRTPIGKGIEIIENLMGHTSGFAVPRYVVDAPGGGGKIPILPNYIISWSTNKVVLRNYEGTICTYKEPDSYVPQFCDRDCDNCDLQLKLNPAEEFNARGIMKLLSDFDETISLVPRGTERMKRRNKNNER